MIIISRIKKIILLIIFLIKELKQGRIYTDQHETSIAYLKTSEQAYLELAELRGYHVIECLEKDKLRDILNIHDEIYDIDTNTFIHMKRFSITQCLKKQLIK